MNCVISAWSTCSSKLLERIANFSYFHSKKLTFLWLVIEWQKAGIWHWSMGFYSFRFYDWLLWVDFVENWILFAQLSVSGTYLFFGDKVNTLARHKIALKRTPARDFETAIRGRQYLAYLIGKRDKNVEFLIRYQRKMIDREMIYRWDGILINSDLLANNESAGHALKCLRFSPDVVQYLAGWWALLTFKNIILNGHCIQNQFMSWFHNITLSDVSGLLFARVRRAGRGNVWFFV